MFKYFVTIFAIAGAPSFAEELTHWSNVEEWVVLVDPATNNGCLAERIFDDGTLVQIGAVPSLEGGFFAAYNANWTEVEPGVTGILNFDFGDALFAGDAVNKIYNDLPGGYAFFDNPEFVMEFAKRLTVQISGSKGRRVDIDLSGSKLAIDGVLACQEEQNVPETN